MSMNKTIKAILFLLVACGLALAQTSGGNRGGSQTWPTAPGIMVCTGTPCTAYGASLNASTTYDVYGAAAAAQANSLSGINVIQAKSYGVYANTIISHDVTTTINSTTVTCPECNFTSDDLNKWEAASNSSTDAGITDSIILPWGTITAVTNSTTITVSVAATASNSGAATFAWGNLDSALPSDIQSTANDPLFAAWKAATDACEDLDIGCGNLLVAQPEFDTYNTSAPCGSLDGQVNLRRGFSIHGCGQNHSIIVISPALEGSKCTGPNGAGSGCFLSVPTLTAHDFTLWGMGNSALGSGFNGKVAVQIPGLSIGTNFDFNRVTFHGWGANTPGFCGVCMVSGGPGNYISNGWFDHTYIETFGFTSYSQSTGGTPYQSQIFFNGGYIVACGGLCFNLVDGNFVSDNNLYGWNGGTTDNSLVGSQAMFTSTNDQWPYAFSLVPPYSLLTVAGGGSYGIATLTNATVYGLGSAAGSIGIKVNAGATLNLTGATIGMPYTKPNSLQIAGVVNAGVANTIAGYSYVGSGVMNKAVSTTDLGTICTSLPCTDGFTTPQPDPGWTFNTGSVVWTSASHSIYPNGASSTWARYTGGTFTANQYSQCTWGTAPTSGYFGVAVRIGPGTSQTGYGEFCTGSSCALQIHGGAGGTPMTFAAPSPGDVEQLSITGNVLTMTRNSVPVTALTGSNPYTDASASNPTGTPGISGYGTDTAAKFTTCTFGDI